MCSSKDWTLLFKRLDVCVNSPHGLKSRGELVVVMLRGKDYLALALHCAPLLQNSSEFDMVCADAVFNQLAVRYTASAGAMALLTLLRNLGHTN